MTYNLERRQFPRKRFEHLLYVELEPGNGGMVLNFSEHGFGFRAAKRVRPNEEVRFAFNLDDKRRLEGRGRLEWADKDGRVAGLRFTDVSEQFRTEMRTWLSTAREYAAKSPRKSAPVSPPPAGAEPSASEVPDPVLSSRRRDDLAKSASAKSVRSISSIPSNSSFPPAPDISAETFVAENPHIEDPVKLPWAAVFPPAVGYVRKPTATMPEPAAQPTEFSAAAAFKLARFDPETAEEPEPAEGLEEPLELEKEASAVPQSVPENPITAVEARTAAALNEHAQALCSTFSMKSSAFSPSFASLQRACCAIPSATCFPFAKASKPK
jgi:hypothetical protein